MRISLVYAKEVDLRKWSRCVYNTSPHLCLMTHPYLPPHTLLPELEQLPLPCFLTHLPSITERLQALRDAFEHVPLQILYAMKANPHPAILQHLRDAGINGIDAVSANEAHLAVAMEYPAEGVSFTGVSLHAMELQEMINLGVVINCGSIDEVAYIAQYAPGTSIGLRVRPDVGAGEYAVISTGQVDSKFGIGRDQLPQAITIAQSGELHIVGLHCHIGSGFYEAGPFAQAAERILELTREYAGLPLEWINLGGGFGVRYKFDEESLDLKPFGAALKSVYQQHLADDGKTITIRIEPGKYLVAESTVLLTEVTMIKDQYWLGVNTGMQHLLRPMLYGATHPLVNLTKPDATADQEYRIVGHICESTDVFGTYKLPETNVGDLLCLGTCGAYGASMSSHFNAQAKAAEATINDQNQITMIRGRSTFMEVMAEMGYAQYLKKS